MLDPIQRRQYGIAAMLFSVVLFAVSAGATVTNSIRQQSVVDEVAAADNECVNRMKLLGAKNVVATEELIMAQWGGLEGGYARIGDASAAALACPGWIMKDFCMGQLCSTPGTKLTLQKVQG